MIPQFVGGVIGALLAVWHGRIVASYMPKELTAGNAIKPETTKATPFSQL
jgi:hypothetical protein